MSRHRLSPSKLGLAQHCLYWARPDLDYVDPPAGRAARIGSLVHKMAEALATGQRAADIGPVENDLHEVAEALSIVQGPLSGWIETWRGLDVPRAAELGLRMDLDTGTVRPYPRRGEPGYERPRAHEIGGEVDLVRNMGEYVEAVDLKSGDPRYFTEAQLRAYALMVSRFYGVERVRVAFLRALKTRVTLSDWVELDADALDDEYGRLRRMLRSLPMAEPQPGDHCWMCAAKKANACPAHLEPTDDERDQAFAF